MVGSYMYLFCVKDMVNPPVAISPFYMVNNVSDSAKQLYPVNHGITFDDSSSIPKVGMEFDDEDSAFQFYNLYARKLGFSVRIHNWRKNSKGLLVRKEFVCYKEGYPRTQKDGVTKMKANARCGCPAKLLLKRGLSGKLCVVEFEPIHNHPLASQSKVLTLRSHRTPSGDASDKSGGAPKKQVAERRKLTFLSMDFKNYLRTKRACSPSGGDLGAVMQYLAGKSAEDPSFFSSVQLDEDDLITNIFWVDGRSRVDYDSFSDVLCFDTTLTVNNPGRPFTQFVGINHHKQVTAFGAALIYDQTIETFEWLLQTFEKAMNGKRPKVILTDQDSTIASALANVWPDTCHRICVWQILQSASNHLSHIYSKNDFKNDFSKCLLDCDDEDSFVLAWQDMLMKHDLVGNEWLANLFHYRERWALPYGRETFCADMKSTQKNDNMNAVLKKYLNLETNLSNFFEHYERFVEDRRHAELQQDIKANQTSPAMLFSFLLREAARVYTPNVFEKFREEVLMVSDCDTDYMGEEGSVSSYKVKMVEGVKEYFVSYEASNKAVSCSCKRFEFTGILCCHALKVLDYLKIKTIPEQYILKRWTKEAKSGIMQPFLDDIELNCNEKSIVAARYSLISHALVRIAARASESEETYKYLESQSIVIMENVENMLRTNSSSVHPNAQNLRL